MNLSLSLLAAVVALVAFANPARCSDFYTEFQTGFGFGDMNGKQGWVCSDPTTNAGAILNAGGPFGSRSASLGYVSPLLHDQIYLYHAGSTPLAGGPMNAGFSVFFKIQDSDSGFLGGGTPAARDTFGFRLENSAGTNLFSFFLTPFDQDPKPQADTRYDTFAWSTGNQHPTAALEGLGAQETFAYTFTVHFTPSGVNDVAFVADVNGATFSGILPGMAGEMVAKLGAVWKPLNGAASPGSNFLIFDKIGLKSEPLNLAAQVAGDFTYTSDGSTVTLIAYNGGPGAVVIPSRINGLPVTTLWNSLFAGRTNLTDITLPAGLTTIGSSAFEGCTGLTGVTLPATVTALGNFAFSGCTNLARVFCMGNAPSVGTDGFAQATNATVFYLPGTSDWGSELAGRPAVLWSAEIAVEQPIGTGLADGTSAIDCGPADLGNSAAPLTVTVKNPGTADLTGLALTQDGPQSADFTVSALATTTLAPGETTTFTVTFAPGAVGTRTAALHLASNDGDENPFDIALTGTGRAAVASWRLANFGTTEATGAAANDADPDGDGMSNLTEYGFKMNPQVPEASPVTAAKSGDSLVIFYPRNLVATDVAFAIEKTLDLGFTDPWLTAPVLEEILSTADGVQQVKATLVLPPGTPRAFARLALSLKP